MGEMSSIEQVRTKEMEDPGSYGEVQLLGGGGSHTLEQGIGESLGRKGRMVVVTVSSSKEQERVANYTEAWVDIVGKLSFLQSADFNLHPGWVIDQLSGADWVHFVGGNQLLS